MGVWPQNTVMQPCMCSASVHWLTLANVSAFTIS